jgi:glyoxylase-like metal-dependent hydrolase (beta-lactamase superfamily II)
MLHIKTFTFNAFQENTYLLYDDKGVATLIDPGCFDMAERKELLDFVSEKNLRVTQLLNTHCHIDHVLGNAWAKRTFTVPLLIHKADEEVLKAVEVYALSYGFPGYEPSEADGYLREGENITVGDETLEIRFVPGHAPGHVVFFDKESLQCIAGDTLFRGSIGRTDLPGGNHHLLIEKIKSQLFTLPEETVVYPGHGPETTIAFEKKHNPFVGKNATS